MNLAGFCDVDRAGNVDDRKSTSEGYFYLGNNMISWHRKKHNSILLSTTKVEYIVAGSCYTQLLWMKQMIEDYGIVLDCLTRYCDNTNAIKISKIQYNILGLSILTFFIIS